MAANRSEEHSLKEQLRGPIRLLLGEGVEVSNSDGKEFTYRANQLIVSFESYRRLGLKRCHPEQRIRVLSRDRRYGGLGDNDPCVYFADLDFSDAKTPVFSTRLEKEPTLPTAATASDYLLLAEYMPVILKAVLKDREQKIARHSRPPWP